MLFTSHIAPIQDSITASENLIIQLEQQIATIRSEIQQQQIDIQATQSAEAACESILALIPNALSLIGAAPNSEELRTTFAKAVEQMLLSPIAGQIAPTTELTTEEETISSEPEPQPSPESEQTVEVEAEVAQDDPEPQTEEADAAEVEVIKTEEAIANKPVLNGNSNGYLNYNDLIKVDVTKLRAIADSRGLSKRITKHETLANALAGKVKKDEVN